MRIKINPGRREAEPKAVEELARSIAAVGLLNPITLDQHNTLVAGLHRLEAAKLLESFDLRGKYIIADKGYDSDRFVHWLEKRGAIVVIPSRKSAKRGCGRKPGPN